MSDQQDTTAVNKSQVVSSIDAWGERGTHDPTLESGTVVAIRIPDLPAMIEAGEIPNHLIDAALAAANSKGQDRKATKDDIIRQREFTDKLVQITVLQPKLSDEDLRKIPYEDKEMIVEFAVRARDLDAEGNHLAGLEESEKFRRFRRLGEFSEDLAGL